MSERGNEFELWSSRFLGDQKDGRAFSLVGLPPSTFQVVETPQEIHKRLDQICVLDRIAHGRQISAPQKTPFANTNP